MYGLVGVVLHKQLTSGLGHYTLHLFAPLLTNVSDIMQLIHRYCVAYIMDVLRVLLSMLIPFQVIPVSVATVVQQEPVLLFYKWMDGINTHILMSFFNYLN